MTDRRRTRLMDAVEMAAGLIEKGGSSPGGAKDPRVAKIAQEAAKEYEPG